MIYSLNGKVNRVEENTIIVDVNGVDFEVCCSSSSASELSKEGISKVYTYLHVREDVMMLFGFSNLSEKKMFLNLISVNGIGPKMAISILSSISSRSLASAVANGEVGLLTKIKGLGKKTAERIVLELKEKVEANVKLGSNMVTSEDERSFIGFTQAMNDAVAILTELGIKKEEALKLVKSKASESDLADEIVRKCL